MNAMSFPDGLLNIGNQGFYVCSSGSAVVDDKIGMTGGNLGLAKASAFKAALVDEPAGRRPLGRIFKDAAASKFFGRKFGLTLLNDAAMTSS